MYIIYVMLYSFVLPLYCFEYYLQRHVGRESCNICLHSATYMDIVVGMLKDLTIQLTFVSFQNRNQTIFPKKKLPEKR